MISCIISGVLTILPLNARAICFFPCVSRMGWVLFTRDWQSVPPEVEYLTCPMPVGPESFVSHSGISSFLIFGMRSSAL